MEQIKSTLKEKVNAMREAEKMGGFRVVQDIRPFFPAFDNAVSQKVTLRTFEKEDMTVYNVEFAANRCVTMTGEIADRILRDFPQHFEVLAINGLATKIPNDIRELKNGSREFVLDTKGGQPVQFDCNAFNEANKPKEVKK